MRCHTLVSKFPAFLFSVFCVSSVTTSLAMHEVLLTKLRDKNTNTKEFRRASDSLMSILASYASEYIATSPVGVTTLCGVTQGVECIDDVVLLPVLRSGNVMLNSFLHIFEDARVGFILLQRDEETALPQFYYLKMPEITSRTRVIVLEPMLATGGSLSKTLELLTEMGIPADHIIITSVICAPEGLDRIHQEYPDVKIIFVAKDAELNNTKFIVPGLGDYGDRYYGTH